MMIRSAGVAADGWGVVVDLGLPSQPLGRELERPGRDHGGHEAHREDDDDSPGGRVAQSEQGKEGLDDLDDQPRKSDIRGGGPQHVATLEFLEEAHRPSNHPPLSPDS